MTTTTYPNVTIPSMITDMIKNGDIENVKIIQNNTGTEITELVNEYADAGKDDLFTIQDVSFRMTNEPGVYIGDSHRMVIEFMVVLSERKGDNPNWIACEIKLTNEELNELFSEHWII